MECLYKLEKSRYNEVTSYLKSKGTDVYCSCSKCLYYMKRIEAKGMIPKHVYDSGTFQQTLRMVNGIPHRSVVMSNGEIESFVKALFGLGE